MTVEEKRIEDKRAKVYRLLEIKDTLTSFLCTWVSEEEMNSVIEWEGTLCKIRDIPTLRIVREHIVEEGEERYQIKIRCKTILPKERYTATKEKLYLSNGQMLSCFYMNNCYDSMLFPRLHDLEHLATEEERLKEMQRIMDQQKKKDIYALMEDHGYFRDEILEDDGTYGELERQSNGEYIILNSESKG